MNVLNSLDVKGTIVMGDGGTIGQAAGPLLAFDDTNDYLEITGANVGIGTTAPATKLEVAGNPTTFNDLDALAIMSNDTDAYNASPLSGIGFGTKYNVAGDMSLLGGISVGKENTTTANRASFLVLHTSIANGTVDGKVRIASTGNVGIGTDAAASKLCINGGLHVGGDSDAGDNNLLVDGTATIGTYNTTDSNIKTGSLELQPYALNNGFLTENCYYNGGWKYRATGYAGLFYFTSGEGQFRFFDTGVAGAALPNSGTTTQFKVHDDGTVALGGTMADSAGTYTGAKMYVGADGNVGIGTLAPLSELCINGGLHVGGDSDAGDNNLLVDGTITSTAGDLTVTNGNVVVASGHGIDFSATGQVAGMTSELFDDYEVGTWTMGMTFGGGTTGITYTLRGGYYTKIGNLVTVTGFLLLSSKGSSTGAALLTGLPFAATNAAPAVSSPSFYYDSIKFANQFEGYINQGEAVVTLLEITEAGVSSVLRDTDFANASAIGICVSYRTG